MIIDCHAHIVPSALLDAIRTDQASFPSIKLIEEGGIANYTRRVLEQRRGMQS